MRPFLACAIGLFIVAFQGGCESTLPPLQTIEPTFSYVRDSSPDTVVVNASDMDRSDMDRSNRSAAVAIVND